MIGVLVDAVAGSTAVVGSTVAAATMVTVGSTAAGGSSSLSEKSDPPNKDNLDVNFGHDQKI
jgi:hypothetical protein